jgi:hypothetical protein
MVNRYLDLVEYLVNLKSDSNFKFESKIKFIAVTQWKFVAVANTPAYKTAVLVKVFKSFMA